MGIRNIGIRTNLIGQIVLTVSEDFNYGEDFNSMPNSLSNIRVRNAIPSDMIEIIKNNVEWLND